MKEGIIPFDQEYNLKLLILEPFGINICVVWSSYRHIVRQLTDIFGARV